MTNVADTARTDQKENMDTSSAAPVIEVKDLEVVYETPNGALKAVDGVSFSLRPGERLALVGESGSGKTTLATALMRLTKAPGRITAGSVVMNGRNLLEASDKDMRSMRLSEIALMPQGAMNSLNPVMRIGEQIYDGIVAHEGKQARAKLVARATELLERVGLEGSVQSLYPHELSGGMKQRVAMAIATSLSPTVIVADEPTSALDVVVQQQVMVTLGEVQEGLNAAIILVGHDMGLVAQFADLIGVMYAGRLVELATVQNLFKNPQHPYTRLLIDSLPTLEEKSDLIGIPGLPPTLLNLPPGCAFAPRCPYAFERCSDEIPAAQSLPSGTNTACHLYPEHSELPTLAKSQSTAEAIIESELKMDTTPPEETRG